MKGAYGEDTGSVMHAQPGMTNMDVSGHGDGEESGLKGSSVPVVDPMTLHIRYGAFSERLSIKDVSLVAGTENELAPPGGMADAGEAGNAGVFEHSSGGKGKAVTTPGREGTKRTRGKGQAYRDKHKP